MAKQNRGKSLWKKFARTRGTCPVCGATRTKLLYTVQDGNGRNLSVCKRCRKK